MDEVICSASRLVSWLTQKGNGFPAFGVCESGYHLPLPLPRSRREPGAEIEARKAEEKRAR